MENKRNVSTSPHVRDKITTSNIMLYVVLSLVPAIGFGFYNFGLNAVLITVTCAVSCVLFEELYNKMLKKPTTWKDYSALLTGLLLAMNLPSTMPLWMCVVGSFIAIVLGKQVFGGLGQNFMNPALAGRAFLMASFAKEMTSFTPPIAQTSVDAMTYATPLASLKAGNAVDVMSVFFGNVGGTIGETSAIALLVGAAALLFLKIIDWKIPVVYIGTFSVMVILFGGHGLDLNFLFAHIFGGGLILGAFFMATDYVTSPVTPMGRIVFGLVLGFLTGAFRLFGPSAEGVSYAIIFSNLLVPLIEKYTVPKPFGYVKPAKKKAEV